MKQEWKKKRLQLTASALIAVLLAGGMAPPQSLADAFVFIDEDGGEEEIFDGGSRMQQTENSRAASASEARKEEEEENSRAASASEARKEEEEENSCAASVSEAQPAEEGVQKFALAAARSVSSLGDLWDDWDADFSFLDGSQGIGTEKKPYQIKTKQQLMGLSQLAAMGMKLESGEGREEIIGSYEGAWFKLMSNMDLGGMDWNPIGYYRDSSEMTGEILNPFCGHFDGNGKTISNFRLRESSWPGAGFFGALEHASVENLTLCPGKTVEGKKEIGILAGRAYDSRIGDCTVEGHISAAGSAGGIVGIAEGTDQAASVIENCTARVTISLNGTAELYAGGIAGKAAETSIVDCRTETGDNTTARIQGTGAVCGGITGVQNHTDIYNSFVSGTIGGAGTETAGGITGLYVSGNMKVARFEGTIGQSGLGSAGYRGTFIGKREAGDWFNYGEDVGWLFADTEAKIAANVCGSTIPDDNEYTYDARIGYSHEGDLFYSLVQGGVSRDVTEEYYYEVLEEGILEIMDEDDEGAPAEELGYELDHVAPGDSGRPVRGYLITIPQVDTVSGGSNYYDVAVLEARGSHTWDRTLDKDNRGAVEAGTTVTVTTSPRQTEDARFQMNGVPLYTEAGERKETAYAGSGAYTFTMPAENTEVSAVYEKVAVKVSVVPAEYHFSVIEERTGNRKNPVKTTRVMDTDGRLIASYINGILEQGTVVHPVLLGAVVDRNNDVADASIRWSVDDPELITLLSNSDQDNEGYTEQSASILLNLDAGFFKDTIRSLEKKQSEAGYRYPIADAIYGAGHQNGGTVILTASTRPASSFEGKPCTANAKISVTYQVKDRTYLAAEEVLLDKELLEYTVTRTLTGNRRNPAEKFTVTGPQSLRAELVPDAFDRKVLQWRIEDSSIAVLDGEGKEALITAVKDAKWIRDLTAGDEAARKQDFSYVSKGSGTRSTAVSILAEDMLGNRRTDSCEVKVHFVTKDETWYSGSSSGSGSSGGSGGGSSGGSSSGGSRGSSGVTPAGGIGPAGGTAAVSGNAFAGGTVPEGSVTGTWVNTADGRWSFTSGGRTYYNEWAYIHNPYAGPGQEAASWFRFDENGSMMTGWFTDNDQNQYYLWPESDGTMGRMVTGDCIAAGPDGKIREYSFHTVSDGTKGRLLGVKNENPEVKEENLTAEALPEAVQGFLGSHDWNHMSERERAERIYERIANGQSGNRYGAPEGTEEWSVFLTGVGLCRNFAEEYEQLARRAGLTCETYQPSLNHEACLILLDGQWYALDPSSGAPFSSNLAVKAVNYETEVKRMEQENKEFWKAYYGANPENWAAKLAELDARYAKGELTAEEYQTEWNAWSKRE